MLREIFLELIDQWCLIGPFREISPDLQRYTWSKKIPFRQARFDFFFISDNMLTNVRKCKIEPSYRTDHSMVVSRNYA